jgi:hypothetical protein
MYIWACSYHLMMLAFSARFARREDIEAEEEERRHEEEKRRRRKERERSG